MACELNDYTIQKRYFANLDQTKLKTVKHELQLDFFRTESESEVDRLIRMTEEIRDSTGKVRRKLFAENSELKRKVLDLESRLAILERHICHS